MLGDNELPAKFRELVGVTRGVTTIGVNMRTASDIPQELLERIVVVPYPDTRGQGCLDP